MSTDPATRVVKATDCTRRLKTARLNLRDKRASRPKTKSPPASFFPISSIIALLQPCDISRGIPLRQSAFFNRIPSAHPLIDPWNSDLPSITGYDLERHQNRDNRPAVA